ncbi:ArsR/SmtB family transcription factor [Actinokineospora enzanensis]|uniref:ArsR/SmtB family transcription factor n=1 Tax=Actinokineospora enzanensis TaxID=155975 RepID=UPI00036B4E36|nr:winged helix-turn-helix domain-containing protein [Actinokineospora enzanensis]
MGSAIRLRIIRLTHQRALTNKEIAERLDKDPATTLHHIRKLVATGFLEAQPARRGNRGAKEIPYLSTGLSWRLSAGHGGPRVSIAEAMLQAYLTEVSDAGLAAIDQSRMVVQVDAAARLELMDRMGALLDEFAARPPDPDVQRTAVYVAFYPGE